MTTVTASSLRSPAPKVLIADADIDSHQIYATALGFDDRALTFATDGRDALVAALKDPYALLITETRLPYIDGYALCNLLRGDNATRTMPIIVVTTDSRPAARQRALQAGANAVIIKPFDSGLLQAEARELADRTLDAGPGFVLARLKDFARRDRSTALVARVKSDELKAPGKSRAHKRYKTTTPPITPAPVHCPSCARSLQYESSQIGGVNAIDPEQWDYYVCAQGCGRFQYRPRTRKLRIV